MYVLSAQKILSADPACVAEDQSLTILLYLAPFKRAESALKFAAIKATAVRVAIFNRARPRRLSLREHRLLIGGDHTSTDHSARGSARVALAPTRKCQTDAVCDGEGVIIGQRERRGERDVGRGES